MAIAAAVHQDSISDHSMTPNPHRRPRSIGAIAGGLLALLALLPGRASAQGHEHRPGMTHPAAPAGPQPTEGGQAAFAAIGEIVRLLEADSTTDWRKVDLERLRQHLIDMDLVTLHARVTSQPLPAGARFTVRGTGVTVGAIHRMTRAHAAMVAREGGPQVAVEPTADGAIVTVTARTADDAKAVARIRGLGFIGMMASGDHHTAHHLALARGDAMADHGH
jgi:hypothetical protein